MSSQPRSSRREEDRRLNIRTLAIASIASAAAAVITSQFWVQGTWMAAAFTPVIVALVSEMLHRPTEVIAERVTTRGPGMLPATGGPDRAEDPAPAEPGSEGGPPAPPVRVYRTGEDKPVRPRASRRKIAVGAVAVTAVLAFAITAVAITGTELLAGGSIGKGEGRTTLLGGDSDRARDGDEQQESQPEGSSPESGQPEGGSGEGSESQPQPEQQSEEPPAEEQPEQPAPEPQTPDLQAPQQQP
jgi:hypothetical protein